MRPRVVAVSLSLLLVMLLACTLAGAPAAPQNTTPNPPAASTEPTLPPLAPGTAAPTDIPPTPTLAATITPSATATLTATATSTITPRPISTGPLDFTVSVIGCRPDPEREGGVILKMRFDATGGNGVYTYYRENHRTTSTFERPATKGTAIIDAYRVESGDGQSIDKKERFTGAQFGCS